eukprot:TRINITY_DN28467_c0_g1_i1.p1 TRINITY_DN28467_c0_g1~~TRINITY_DN28467_c0_g1_i1.p1  ORF type:complete len:186 (+),score=46.25 TRINITY_DN28467_c0_g1_i1:81-560(+)
MQEVAVAKEMTPLITKEFSSVTCAEEEHSDDKARKTPVYGTLAVIMLGYIVVWTPLFVVSRTRIWKASYFGIEGLGLLITIVGLVVLKVQCSFHKRTLQLILVVNLVLLTALILACYIDEGGSEDSEDWDLTRFVLIFLGSVVTFVSMCGYAALVCRCV